MSYYLEINEACRHCLQTNKCINFKQPEAVCSHCGEWASITIAREVKGGKASTWNQIRQRPAIRSDVDYQLCKRHGGPCHKVQCTFPHSDIELKVWTKQRADEEPRSHIGRHLQLCKIMLNGGVCKVSCPYAHSPNELHHWENKNIRLPPRIQPHLEFQMCRHVLNNCTCPKGQNCKFAHSSDELYFWKNSTPSIRSAPLLPMGVQAYKFCRHVRSGNRCLHGPGCKFAHSQLELNKWNSLLQKNTVLSQDFACQVREIISRKFCKESILPKV